MGSYTLYPDTGSEVWFQVAHWGGFYPWWAHTFMHELGHNLWLDHASWPSSRDGNDPCKWRTRASACMLSLQAGCAAS